MRKNHIVATAVGIALAFTISCGGEDIKSIKMPDGKEWMAKNLDIATGKSECYDNDPANCKKCGRLYDWETAIKACPNGWHLPTEIEFENLIKSVGGEEEAGKALKSKEGWDNNGNGTDKHGFSMFPCGTKDSDGKFERLGIQGILWSAEEKNEKKSQAYIMGNNNEDCRKIKKDKTYLYSVRCVKN